MGRVLKKGAKGNDVFTADSPPLVGDHEALERGDHDRRFTDVEPRGSKPDSKNPVTFGRISGSGNTAPALARVAQMERATVC